MSTEKRNQLKKFYVLHSWVGVITGILLFVIAFTGAMSVFARPDLKLWANESLHSPSAVTPEIVAELMHKAVEDADPSFQAEVHAFLPSPRVSTNLILILEQNHDEDPDAQALWLEYQPQTLELVKQWQGHHDEMLEQDTHDMADFIGGFHADLHLGRLGLILTGLLGLTLMASIATGLFIHRKILKELFTFRPDRSLRLLLTDTHKVISVWGILFHGMIGFTGAFLGLATVILVPAAAFVSFSGDQEKLLATFTAEVEPERSGVAAPMKIRQVLEDAYSNKDLEIVRFSVYGWGDQNALGYIDSINRSTMPRETRSYQMSDAKPLEVNTSFSKVGGISGPVLDAMFPLHFGNFGGLPVRILWAILGISTALIALTGMMIWVERRAYGAEGQLAPKQYLRLSRLTIGSCVGLVLACSSLFVWQRVLPTYVEEGFFTVWGIALLWGLLRTNDYQSSRQLIAASGLVLLLLPAVDAVTLDQHFFNNPIVNHFNVMTVCLVLLGAGLLWLAKKLPAERPEENHKTKSNRSTNDEEQSLSDELAEDLAMTEGNA